MLYNPYIRYMKTNYLFLLIFLTSTSVFSQNNLVSDEEFNSKISWLLPNEEILPLEDVIYKVRGYNRRRGGFEVDGILSVSYTHLTLPTILLV